MHFTISHTTSLLCVSYLDDLSQIVTNIREIILQTTRVFFRRAWWKEVASLAIEENKALLDEDSEVSDPVTRAIKNSNIIPA